MTTPHPAVRRGHPHHSNTPPAATRSKRTWLIASLAVLLIAVAGVGVTACHHKATGAELVLTAATDPGANAFMPPAASPPPINTQPPPTLQPQGDDTAVATQPLPGDRDGLYGGTLNNPASDREQMITFLGAHPSQAGAFVDALNTDTTMYWSGGRPLTVADIPAYLRELTPALLRLDTRVTNHGFDGTHPTTVQSVFQAGNAVLVDPHGVPRVRGLSGNPLTAPVALRGTPNLVGTAWAGYRSGALAAVLAAAAAITNFVLVDVVTGHPFNRPAGTTGTNDTPHTQPVAPPEVATSAAATSGQAPQLDIDGTYFEQPVSTVPKLGCGSADSQAPVTQTVTHQGNTVTIGGYTGTLNADGSFSATGGATSFKGRFTTEGGRTVYHAEAIGYCDVQYVGTRQ
jgi:hypothetical protein